MAITYTPATDVIEVTGYSELTPCTLEDIYQEDILGGWGQVSKQGSDQYLIDAHVEIGTVVTTGWFADEAKQLVMGNRREWRVKTEGHCRFGELLDEDEGTIANSCAILVDLTSATDGFRLDGEFEFYGGIFLNSTRASGMFYISPDNDTYKMRFWNLLVSEVAYTYEYGSFGAAAKNWRRSTISNNLYGLNLTTGAFPSEHFNDTVVQGCDYGVRNTWLGYYQDDEISVRNLWIKDSQTKDFMCFNWGQRGYQTVILNATGYVDCVPGDIGETVYDDGAARGALLAYDNATRTWEIYSTTTIGVGSALTIPTGTGAGTASADSTYTPFTADFYAINAISAWTINWSGSIDGPSKLHRQYSFNLKIVDEDGATVDGARVQCWDKDSVLIFDVNTGVGAAPGEIEEQIVEYAYYHPDGLEVPVLASPHTIKVSKADYTDIDYVGNLDEPIDWTLTLTAPCYPWTVDKINAAAAPGYDHSQVANYPMSWNDGSNMLTFWGDDGSGGKEAMGYDADHPITEEEVWAFAAYTKGTCICTKDSDDAFTNKARLIIGNGTAATYFASENQSVWQYDYFIVANHAVMRLGSIATDVSNPYPDPKWGSSWTIERKTTPHSFSRCYFVRNGGELYLYDSRIALTDNSKAFDTELGAYTYVGYSTFAGYDRLDATFIRWWGVLEFDHMTLHHCRNMNFPTPPHQDSAVLNIYDNQNNLQIRDYESWVWDATLANAITCACKTLQSGKANLVDPVGLDYDKICVGGMSTNYQSLWHRFARKVIDENGAAIVGARVQVWDKDAGLVYDELTDADGWTAVGTPADTTKLIREWQTTTTGEPLTYPDDFDLRGPFTVRNSYDGTTYLTIEETIEISQNMGNWEVTMTDVADIMAGLADIKGNEFVADVHSLVDLKNVIVDTENNIRGADNDDLKGISGQLDSTAPKDEYDTEMARLDADVSSRSSHSPEDVNLVLGNDKMKWSERFKTPQG